MICIPHIFRPGCVAGRRKPRARFDLETNQRIAEFKFIHWRVRNHGANPDDRRYTSCSDEGSNRGGLCAPDGKTLAIVRRANRKVQLEYPEGKLIYATSGYLDYVRVSPSGKEVAFAEHPV